ncbi:DEAD/DEAH box helicase [Candidatus Latescibacterota bacterium]
MRKKELETYINRALDELKDFQNCTVDTVYQSFFEQERHCMLVADEVGLGKTIVARGLIARVLKKRMEEGRRSPYKVTYICSNQVIAHENLHKLNLFPKCNYLKPPVPRIAYLARDEENSIPNEVKRQSQRLLEFNSLTPATSFQIRNSIGTKWERAILYAIMCSDEKLSKHKNGLMWMMKGGVRDMDQYGHDLKLERNKKYRKDLHKRFIKILKREPLPKSTKFVYENLPGRRQRKLYDAVLEFTEIIIDKGSEELLHQGCLELIRRLRRILIKCCLRYVDADLFILDEFQRFRDLINVDSEEEQAVIAREVFKLKKKTKILLLSATPFKAYTGYDDIERGEDHFKDFSRVLKFLLNDNQKVLQDYEQHRKLLYKQILNLRCGALEITTHHRDAVENVLRQVICRTERQSVADDPNTLIHDTWKEEDIPFSLGDIENFNLTDRIIQALNKLGCRAGKPIEYCKSALYPLSYLDNYKVKEELKKHRANPEIQADLKESRNGWLDLRKINSYSWSIESTMKGVTPANARLKMLAEKAIGDKGAELLWVPPSLPYYSLEGSFANSAGFSKTLMFSAWIMVPRMAASLISYEVERRTIGNLKTVDAQEKKARTYFTLDKKKRHPVPQLRYARRVQDDHYQLANMSNFTLLYPSQTLVDAIQPAKNLGNNLTLSQLKDVLCKYFKDLIKEARLEKYVSRSTESERWYWAAPLLLDREHNDFNKVTNCWFENREQRKRNTYSQQAGDEAEVKEEHVNFLKGCFVNPEKAGLGAIPNDLAEILAELALGSPAIVALRSLANLFPAKNQDDKVSNMVKAFDVADHFIAMVNKPESISAIRLNKQQKWYWRMVANYCASGCLQSVFDEYFHLLKGQNVDLDSTVAQLLSTINLNTSVINVDSLETFKKNKPKKMRCHYAVEFGSQKIETEDGQKRAASLREVFNSPFRPFLLATTSVGQEGLDFHSYCRQIIHWNLPGNPIDFEQREGRINRYKGLVIRQNIAQKYLNRLASDSANLNGDVWEKLFNIAAQEEQMVKGKCELVPYWHLETEDIKIERIIPMYPFSRDRGKLEHILRTLAIYRLAFGQPRQTELVEYLLKRNFSAEELKEIIDKLLINLCPIKYSR